MRFCGVMLILVACCGASAAPPPGTTRPNAIAEALPCSMRGKFGPMATARNGDAFSSGTISNARFNQPSSVAFTPGVPDIQGTQGTFSFHTTGAVTRESASNRIVVPFEKREAFYHSYIPGPPDTLRTDSTVELRAPFRVKLAASKRKAEMVSRIVSKSKETL